jgi:hypothetical protein
MKKYLAILFLFLGLSLNVFSQDAERKGYIGISLGPSIPTGEFAKTDFNSDALNYASAGAVFDVSFAYKLGKKLGIAATLRGQSNSLNVKAIGEDFVDANPGAQISIEGDSWGLGGILIGGYGIFPLTQNGRLNFEAKLMFGYMQATCPKFTIHDRSPGSNYYVVSEENESSDLAGFISAGISYKVGRKVALMMILDGMQTGPEFKDVTGRDSNGDVFIQSFNQKMATINFSVGVEFLIR